MTASVSTWCSRRNFSNRSRTSTLRCLICRRLLLQQFRKCLQGLFGLGAGGDELQSVAKRSSQGQEAEDGSHVHVRASFQQEVVIRHGFSMDVNIAIKLRGETGHGGGRSQMQSIDVLNGHQDSLEAIPFQGFTLSTPDVSVLLTPFFRG